MGAFARVKVLVDPATISLSTNRTALPVNDTLAVPPPPLVTTAPEVKSMVVTFTTGVIPSVTVSELPEPPPPPAPVISISLLPRH